MAEFDAIVVGSGMSGGWAAKELSERGLKVLVIERGNEIVPEEDYKDLSPPWERPNLNRVPQDEIKNDYPIQQKGVGYAFQEVTKQYWVKDSEHPYEGDNFDWLRGYHTAGRSIMWSRLSLRLGPQDFEANLKDGHGVDWPVRYDDIAKWYDHAERFAGIAGQNEGIPHLPDGIFQPPFEMTPAEKHLRKKVQEAFPGRNVIHGRTANLTQPTEEQLDLGRNQCQVRNQCHEGCSFKAYFSSLHATLPAAERTGNCTIIHDKIVHSVEYDDATKRVTAVNTIDQNTKETQRHTAKMIFLNASTIGTAMILLQSKSEAFPTGLANRSDQVGRNLMDHLFGSRVSGELDMFHDIKTFGRRPSGIYIPPFANTTEMDKPHLRGYGYQGSAMPIGPGQDGLKGIGRDFKDDRNKDRPAAWRIGLYAFGEILPNPENRVTLHPTRKDRWGLPITKIDVSMSENEEIMLQEAHKEAIKMLEAAGCTNIYAPEPKMSNMGDRIHEMGTARMGRDPNTSVLNGWNQAHDIDNLFITDGSFMASSAAQNPSLTYMAFSARASNYAADLLQAGKL